MRYLFCFLIPLLFFTDHLNAQSFPIIPYPSSLQASKGFFTFNISTGIYFNEDAVRWKHSLFTLTDKMERAGGIMLKECNERPSANAIIVSKSDMNMPEGAYRLIVNESVIELFAVDEKGVFYAIQTILQLLPPGIFSSTRVINQHWALPCVQITDQPAFPYRGLMIDVARHFLPIDYLRKLIDLMALQKMNNLHLHLTDDQGWRMEIKKYPLLTKVGSVRGGTLIGRYPGNGNDQKEYGGYYSQEELRSLVSYASDRHVNIIPEIELPGHSSAAIAAYPQLSCFPTEPSAVTQSMTSHKAYAHATQNGGKVVQETWGVFNDVFCPTPFTFRFLEEVMDEVMDVFPSPYIHIGGDECPKESWKRSSFCQDLIQKEGLTDEHGLQSYFIERIERYLNNKGRMIIGWDEILEGGLAPNATVMSWRGTGGGIAAAQQNHDVIMSPVDFCYLNLYQSEDPSDSIAWGGFLPMSKVYQYDPYPADLNDTAKKYIQGVQANLWTEYIRTPDLASYMLFPRLFAIAETGWSTEKKGYEHFTERVVQFFPVLKAMGVNHSSHLYNLGFEGQFLKDKRLLKIGISGAPIDRGLTYSVNGNSPIPYTSAFMVKDTGTIEAMVMMGNRATDKKEIQYRIRQSTGNAITLYPLPDAPYNKGGVDAWANGLLGSHSRYNDHEWLGWNGKDFNGVIDFGADTDFQQLTVRFFNAQNSWVYLPSEVELFTSSDGEVFHSTAKWPVPESDQIGALRFSWAFPSIKARYVKVIARNNGLISEGQPGAGQPAWLFVDEVEIY